jgi:hypothetical protein
MESAPFDPRHPMGSSAAYNRKRKPNERQRDHPLQSETGQGTGLAILLSASRICQRFVRAGRIKNQPPVL